MDNAQKLSELRKILKDEALHAFLVPHANEYQAEFPPECARRLTWLTGFTGSAGMAVVTLDSAMVMSDGRYTIQLTQEVDTDLFTLENSQQVKVSDWLLENVADAFVGYDPKLHSASEIESLMDAGVLVGMTTNNPIDMIWNDQPEPPSGEAFLFPDDIAGQTAKEKIKIVQAALKDEGVKFGVLNHPETVAWLLNIRGNDVSYTPIIKSCLVVPVDGVVQWCGNISQIPEEIQNHLSGSVEFLDESNMSDVLDGLANKAVLLDPKRSPIWFQQLLESVQAKIVKQDDPCILLRACKTVSEQTAMKNAHVRDGVAMVKFLKWFEGNAQAETLDELIVEQQLEEFRREAPEFVEPSFNTISGFGSNGAIVHYRATEKSNQKITKNNLLLLDSGAQYSDGTTDITRTIAVGKPSTDMVFHNTLVMKGHIAVVSAQFNDDVTGKEIDALARQYLQAEGLDYAHGTGHGVGCYLSVHEEATSINPREDKTFQEGMIISNEPGFYKEGAYGIRIENLILVQSFGDNQLCFETITMAPFDMNLVDVSLLSNDEIEWLNNYHQTVFEKLSSFLDQDHQEWLQEKTAAI